jgi:sulfide:quinone oxidoreductase
VIEGRLAANGIDFVPAHVATAVTKNAVHFGDKQRPFDLLLAIPPHRCPEVVVESGLTNGRHWVPVNPRTLQTGFPGVYAIGDVAEVLMANGKPLPKAGVFAEAEGEVVAQQIAANLPGKRQTRPLPGTAAASWKWAAARRSWLRAALWPNPSPRCA